MTRQIIAAVSRRVTHMSNFDQFLKLKLSHGELRVLNLMEDKLEGGPTYNCTGQMRTRRDSEV
eukprot:2616634-Rhodomonas_salina.3